MYSVELRYVDAEPSGYWRIRPCSPTEVWQGPAVCLDSLVDYKFRYFLSWWCVASG